jgi:hypothetical protein
MKISENSECRCKEENVYNERVYEINMVGRKPMNNHPNHAR